MRLIYFKIIIVFSLMISNPSFDFSYELKYGDGTGVTNEGNTIYDLKFNENFVKINSSYNNYYLYLELEYSDPPVLGYSNKEIQEILTKFYIEKQFDKIYAKAGNIYTLYGTGIGIYTFPDQNIDFDNSLKGVELRYALSSYVEPFIVGGTSDLALRTNPAILEPNRFSENTVVAGGINYDTPFGYGHFLYKNQNTYMENSTLSTFLIDEGNRSTLLDWDFSERVDDMISQSEDMNNDGIINFSDLGDDSLKTESFNIGYGIYSDLIDVYFEGEWAEYSKMLGEQVDGHRYYLSLSRNIKDVGITYEYKDYDMPYDMITFSAPPTVSIESTSILAARNSHSINYGDEVGHQIEVISPIFRDLNFLGNISVSGRHNAKNKIYNATNLGILDYINNNPFSESDFGVGQEEQYIANLFTECNNLTQNTVNMQQSEEYFPSLTFGDYLSFNQDSQDFISFYPYRQIYGEVSGYFTDNLYMKIGYDIYNEVLKHKDQKIFNYNQAELEEGFNEFNSVVETVANDRWAFFQDQCQQIIDLGIPGIECSGQDVDGNGTIESSESADYEFLNQFGMSLDEYLNSFSLELATDEDYYHQIVEAWTIPIQLTYDLSGGNSTNFYLEYQSKKDSQPNAYTDINNFYFSGSYTHKGFWTVTLFYEEENKNYSSGNQNSDNWPGLDLSFDLEDKGQLSLFYGSQKGGRVCANGICADQPGFEDGLKVTYRTFF